MVRPIQAAWSPDSQALLVLTFGLGPDDPATPLDPAGSSPRLSVRTVNLADGTDRLIGHLPLGTSTALYYAVWGAQGDAITNGYYLQILP
jgi:hypothetical protein